MPKKTTQQNYYVLGDSHGMINMLEIYVYMWTNILLNIIMLVYLLPLILLLWKQVFLQNSFNEKNVFHLHSVGN